LLICLSYDFVASFEFTPDQPLGQLFGLSRRGARADFALLCPTNPTPHSDNSEGVEQGWRNFDQVKASLIFEEVDPV
jgi:hypothetical protein